MSGQTNERAFESYVELMLRDRGWHVGTNAERDVERTVFAQFETAFERLQANRSTVLTAATTGKIDVRGSAQ